MTDLDTLSILHPLRNIEKTPAELWELTKDILNLMSTTEYMKKMDILKSMTTFEEAWKSPSIFDREEFISRYQESITRQWSNGVIPEEYRLQIPSIIDTHIGRYKSSLEKYFRQRKEDAETRETIPKEFRGNWGIPQ